MSPAYSSEPDVTSPSTGAPDRAMDWFGLVSPSNVMHRDSPLSANARLVYVAMTFYASGEDRKNVRPSIATLVGHTGLGKSAVLKARKELVRYGVAVIVKEPRIAPKGQKKGPKNTSTEYRLNDADAHRSRLWNDDDEWIGGTEGVVREADNPCPPGGQAGDQEDDGVVRETDKGYPPHGQGVVHEADKGCPSGDQGVVREADTISTSDQDQRSGPASSTSNQDHQERTPDARTTAAEDSLTRDGQAEAAGEDTTSVDDSEMPAEWQSFLVEIDDHLAEQLLPVMERYWVRLVASERPRYPDQLSSIMAELLMLVQDRPVDQIIAGIDWLFGRSGCNSPHKAEAVRQYVGMRSDPNTVHKLTQHPGASEAEQRIFQAQSPRRRLTVVPEPAPGPAPSATEAVSTRQWLAHMRQRLIEQREPQPATETERIVPARDPEITARIQALQDRQASNGNPITYRKRPKR